MIALPYAYYTQAISSWLKLLNVRVPAAAIDVALENHPEWPSLLCVSDALHSWKVPHAAAKDVEKKPELLPVPFLAVTNHPERPFAIISSTDEDFVTLYQNSYKKPEKIAKQTFLNSWTGVYMVAEPNSQSGLQYGQKNYKRKQANTLLAVSSVFAILAAMGILFWPHIIAADNTQSLLGTGLLYLLYIAGLGISILLLWHEIDKSNPLLQKVCSGIAKVNCNAILNSKASKLLPWLSWSEMGFIYFAGGLLLLAFPAYAPWALHWLGMLSFVCLIYPVFSIYYQWRIARQWCTLCLAVQGVLLMQFLTIVLLLLPIQFSLVSSTVWLGIAFAYGIPAMLWYTVKPALKRLVDAKQERRAYQRLKFNREVFLSLLHKQKAIQTSTQGLGISLGNPAAENTIVKVCNPYCGPCSKAHTKIENLLNQNGNLHVQIIFMVPNEPGQRLHTTASHLMAISRTHKEQHVIQQALDDWYNANEKDYKSFAIKYPMNGQVETEAPAIAAMVQWSLENNINYTPAIFYNGYELPNEYELEDLQYFLQA